MDTLREIPVPHFSLGSLLAPEGWTLDSTRCHVPPTLLKGTPETSPAVSSNTIFLEEYAVEGAAVYITELFVPRGDIHDGYEATLKQNVEKCAANTSKGAFAVEVHEITVNQEEKKPHASRASLVSVLGATHHVFIISVLLLPPNDEGEKEWAEVQKKCHSWVAESYHKPLAELYAFQTFFSEEESEAQGGSEEDRLTRALSLPCSPLLLTDELPEVGHAAIRLKEGGGLVRVLSSFEAFGGKWGQPSEPFAPLFTDAHLSSNPLVFSLSDGTPYAVGTVPLGLTDVSSPSSVFNYLSIECAFEAHLQPTQWSCTNVNRSERFALPEQFLQDVEGYIAEENKTRLRGGRAGGIVASTLLKNSRIPSRQSTYLLKSKDEEKNDRFILLLYAPLVNAAHTIVVVTPFPVTEDETSHAREVGKKMTLMFDTELALQMSWTALASSTTAGYVFRMGQLVLVLPTNDDRYRGATVRPAASQVFNSLGSLSVIANNVEHTFTNKENKLSFSTVSAVFTVLSDGRLPEDFMEDYITEYQYDSGSYPFKWLPTRVEGSSAVTVIEKHKKDVKYAGSTTVKASCVWLCGGESCTTYRRALPLSLGQLLIVELTYAGCASEEERHFLESWVEGIVVSALPRF